MTLSTRSKWIVLFILVLLVSGLFSFRLLSDPDIGTHLKAGKWIIENQRVPGKDTFTYTCTDHDYLDSHWFFQVLIYAVYLLSGYKGLSIFVFLQMALLSYLIWLRIRRYRISFFILSWVVFAGIICMETRITLRPEMFTFIFMTLMLLVLDRYYHEKKKNLWLLPLIMILWCNMHGLFILGLVILGAYGISLFIRDRRPDPAFLSWAGISCLSCLVNPYGYRLIEFPFILTSRLKSENLFHQHIREFTSFNHLDHFLFRDYTFILFFSLAFLFLILTIKKEKMHEVILLAIFFFLAWQSIRNIALFAVLTIPVLTVSARELHEKWKPVILQKAGSSHFRLFSFSLFIISFLFIGGTGLRVYTGSYYTDNNSYNRTGMGLDEHRLPIMAIGFLNSNHLDGRIINSLSLGGWLSWGIRQPVFIDGRLEVMQEGIYSEISNSWAGGLGSMIRKYDPSLIIYNYDTYYSWTTQLSEIGGWRLIYLDGFKAIFAKSGYAPEVPGLILPEILLQYQISPKDRNQVKNVLMQKGITHVSGWLKGFYAFPDDRDADILNLASFCLQMNDTQTAEALFIENLDKTQGASQQVYYALADIYHSRNDNELAGICYKKILEHDPRNRFVKQSLMHTPGVKKGNRSPGNTRPDENEAIRYFNEGNEKFRQGNTQGALTDYKKAVGIKPDYAKAFNNMGIAKASGLNDFAGALKDFEQAARIDPSYSDAFLGSGTCRYNMNDPGKACSDWQKAVSLGNRKAEEMIRKYCK